MVPKRTKAPPPEPGDAVLEMSEHGGHIMASVPRRKRNKPRHLLCFVSVCFLLLLFTLNNRTSNSPLESLKKIIVHIDLFVEEFDKKKPRMTELGEEFHRIGKEVNLILAPGKVAKAGLAGGIIGVIGLGALLAPLTGGASLAAGVAAAGGSAVAVGGAIAQHFMESGGKTIQIPGREFLNIIKPMANKLADIKKSCEKWEKGSANIQSEDVTQYRELIRRVKTWSATRQEKAGNVQDSLRKILELISNGPKTLSEKEWWLVVDSAGQCGNIISEFNSVKLEFIEFKEAVGKLKLMKTI